MQGDSTANHVGKQKQTHVQISQQYMLKVPNTISLQLQGAQNKQKHYGDTVAGSSHLTFTPPL